jgi:hypothetical protein
MEAANKGASDAGAESIGLNIVLPHEQAPNPYVTPYLSFQFHYFALRKMHFLLRARAVAVFPGGFGTLDEFLELLTLIQTGKMKPIPILLFGKDFWSRVINFQALCEEGHDQPGRPRAVPLVRDGRRSLGAHRRVGRSPPLSAASSGRFGVASVHNPSSASNDAIVAASASAEPLVATITGSNTTGPAKVSSRRATAAAMAGEPSMPIFTASAPMSLRQESICASTMIGMHDLDRLHPAGVLRGHRGDRGHRVAAEHRDGLDVRLDARAARAVGAGDGEDAGRGAGRGRRGHAGALASPGGRRGWFFHWQIYALFLGVPFALGVFCWRQAKLADART